MDGYIAYGKYYVKKECSYTWENHRYYQPKDKNTYLLCILSTTQKNSPKMNWVVLTGFEFLPGYTHWNASQQGMEYV